MNTLYELSADEKVQAEYEMRLKAWRDRLSQNEGYYQEGKEEGRKEGRKEGEEKIIELLKSGKSPEEIIRGYDSH